ncbi:hypothetical protein LV457_17990 [Mycobacterium sp. MYCO198283]|nr:hypothetical protein [Mycobacterium sp. MYCO198283]
MLAAQRITLWMTAGVAVVFAVAFAAFPGFFPPMSPRWSAAEVADFYRQHAAMIRFSMITFNLFGVMLVPFFMLIVVHMKRMATPSPVFAYCFLAGAASGATLFAIADLMWLLAAFRPERDPALVVLLNDLAWIVFSAPVGMIVAQLVCLALAVRLDTRAEPVFPKWVAWFSLAVAAAITPSAGAAVVTSGPLAWDGVVSFWLRIVAYGVFLVVMFAVLRRAIEQQAREEHAAAERALVAS